MSFDPVKSASAAAKSAAAAVKSGTVHQFWPNQSPGEIRGRPDYGR